MADNPFGGFFQKPEALMALTMLGQALDPYGKDQTANVMGMLTLKGKQRERDQERQAMILALKQAGFDDATAQSLAANPEAAKLAIGQRQTQEGQEADNNFFKSLGPSGQPSAPAPSGLPPMLQPQASATPDSGNPDYQSAIAGIESGGKYDKLGPITRTGDRAYGKYQVMGNNIPQWTREVLGRAMTPQEFLQSEQAQDAVFNAKFGSYAQKYGPEGAAKAWFAGERGMNNPNARDILGTTVANYGKKFSAALGNGPAMAYAPNRDAGFNAIDAQAAEVSDGGFNAIDAQADKPPVVAQSGDREGLTRRPASFWEQKLIDNPKLTGKTREYILKQMEKAQEEEAKTTNDITNYRFYKKEGGTKTFPEWMEETTSNKEGKYSLSPIWGTDKDGNPTIVQLGKTGEAVQSRLPEGVRVGKDALKIDAGTHWVLLDPVTRQPIRTISKNLEETAAADKVGAAQGAARVALPAAENTAKRAFRMLDEVENHKGLGEGVGFLAGRLPALTPNAADFRERIEQVKAMVFGDAVEVMRGLGALTDKEGPKIEAAKARLNTAKSEADFRTALKDVREVFQEGIENARKKAGATNPAPSQGGAPTSQGSIPAPPPGFQLVR